MPELWEPKRRIEVAFQRNLSAISKLILSRVGADLSTENILRVLQDLVTDKYFHNFAEAAAMKMVTHLFDDQGHTWRQAAMANGRGRSIYEALQKELQGPTGMVLREQVRRNAEIIRTLPADLSADVTKYIAQETIKGRRYESIAREIALKFPEQTKARADTIARTEVSKTQTALTESRCRQFGVDWYVWRATGGVGGDGRTRKSHRSMSGVLINWNDPPAPEDLFPVFGKTGKRYRNSLGKYHAGCCPNCRCYPEPVIALDMLEWPAKIYLNGSIRKISRSEFMRLNNAA